ncbi:MAG: toprim domain-containing protein [Proteobacteria bacterium]|nr:toprim domain-containing protein [Pseudomonadota bacterium]
MQDYIAQFKEAMVNVGLTPPSKIIDDGKIYRFSTNHKSFDMAGWYVLFKVGISAGCFGDWRTGSAHTWCVKSKEQMTTQEWRMHHQLLENAKRQRALIQSQEQKLAKGRAQYIWDCAKPADPIHPYLLKKRISPFIARQRGEILVLPIVNTCNELQSLQFISPDGSKKLLSGGIKKSCYIPITHIDIVPNNLIICEGFATGASLKAAYPDRHVIAAIDAGNIKPVAMKARQAWPHAQILICADDDRLVCGNPGITKARAAAIASGAKYVAPPWPKDAPTTLTDFNDLINWIAQNHQETK